MAQVGEAPGQAFCLGQLFLLPTRRVRSRRWLQRSEEIWLARALKRWGRRQHPRKKLHVIDIPVVTSARKLDNGPKLYGMLLLMLIFPFAVRFKSLCGYWYKREDIESRSDEVDALAPSQGEGGG